MEEDVLRGVVAYVPRRVDGDLSVHNAVTSKLSSLGAKLAGRFGKEVTHIVFLKKLLPSPKEQAQQEAALRDLYEKAEKAEHHVSIVSNLWVHACAELGVAALEEEYIVPKPQDEPQYYDTSPFKPGKGQRKATGNRRKSSVVPLAPNALAAFDINSFMFSSSQQINDQSHDNQHQGVGFPGASGLVVPGAKRAAPGASAGAATKRRATSAAAPGGGRVASISSKSSKQTGSGPGGDSAGPDVVDLLLSPPSALGDLAGGELKSAGRSAAGGAKAARTPGTASKGTRTPKAKASTTSAETKTPGTGTKTPVGTGTRTAAVATTPAAAGLASKCMTEPRPARPSLVGGAACAGPGPMTNLKPSLASQAGTSQRQPPATERVKKSVVWADNLTPTASPTTLHVLRRINSVGSGAGSGSSGAAGAASAPDAEADVFMFAGSTGSAATTPGAVGARTPKAPTLKGPVSFAVGAAGEAIPPAGPTPKGQADTAQAAAGTPHAAAAAGGEQPASAPCTILKGLGAGGTPAPAAEEAGGPEAGAEPQTVTRTTRKAASAPSSGTKPPQAPASAARQLLLARRQGAGTAALAAATTPGNAGTSRHSSGRSSPAEASLQQIGSGNLTPATGLLVPKLKAAFGAPSREGTLDGTPAGVTGGSAATTPGPGLGARSSAAATPAAAGKQQGDDEEAPPSVSAGIGGRSARGRRTPGSKLQSGHPSAASSPSVIDLTTQATPFVFQALSGAQQQQPEGPLATGTPLAGIPEAGAQGPEEGFFTFFNPFANTGRRSTRKAAAQGAGAAAGDVFASNPSTAASTPTMFAPRTGRASARTRGGLTDSLPASAAATPAIHLTGSSVHQEEAAAGNPVASLERITRKAADGSAAAAAHVPSSSTNPSPEPAATSGRRTRNKAAAATPAGTPSRRSRRLEEAGPAAAATTPAASPAKVAQEGDPVRPGMTTGAQEEEEEAGPGPSSLALAAAAAAAAATATPRTTRKGRRAQQPASADKGGAAGDAGTKAAPAPTPRTTRKRRMQEQASEEEQAPGDQAAAATAAEAPTKTPGRRSARAAAQKAAASEGEAPAAVKEEPGQQQVAVSPIRQTAAAAAGRRGRTPARAGAAAPAAAPAAGGSTPVRHRAGGVSEPGEAADLAPIPGTPQSVNTNVSGRTSQLPAGTPVTTPSYFTRMQRRKFGGVGVDLDVLQPNCSYSVKEDGSLVFMEPPGGGPGAAGAAAGPSGAAAAADPTEATSAAPSAVPSAAPSPSAAAAGAPGGKSAKKQAKTPGTRGKRTKAKAAEQQEPEGNSSHGEQQEQQQQVAGAAGGFTTCPMEVQAEPLGLAPEPVAEAGQGGTQQQQEAVFRLGTLPSVAATPASARSRGRAVASRYLTNLPMSSAKKQAGSVGKPLSASKGPLFISTVGPSSCHKQSASQPAAACPGSSAKPSPAQQVPSTAKRTRAGSRASGAGLVEAQQGPGTEANQAAAAVGAAEGAVPGLEAIAEEGEEVVVVPAAAPKVGAKRRQASAAAAGAGTGAGGSAGGASAATALAASTSSTGQGTKRKLKQATLAGVMAQHKASVAGRGAGAEAGPAAKRLRGTNGQPVQAQAPQQQQAAGAGEEAGVEGDAEVTITRVVSSSMRPSISIAWTSVEPSAVASIHTACKALGRARPCVEGYEEGRVTHLVVGAERRTLKMLLAVASGAHLVTPQWVTQSLAAGKWLPEEGFAAPGRFAATAAQVRTSQKQQQPGPKPLEGREVCVHCAAPTGTAAGAAATKTGEHKQGLQRLVVALGGRVVPARACNLCVVGTGVAPPRSVPKAVPAVGEEWLLKLAESHVAPDLKLYDARKAGAAAPPPV